MAEERARAVAHVQHTLHVASHFFIAFLVAQLPFCFCFLQYFCDLALRHSGGGGGDIVGEQWPQVRSHFVFESHLPFLRIFLHFFEDFWSSHSSVVASVFRGTDGGGGGGDAPQAQPAHEQP